MRKLKDILNDLKVSIDIKNNSSYSKRVYVYNCLNKEEQNKFNLVADILISSSLAFDKIEEGIIKEGQRTEYFIFDLLNSVLVSNQMLMIKEEVKLIFRSYINKDLTIKEVKKQLKELKK